MAAATKIEDFWKAGANPSQPVEDVWIPSVCRGCQNTCGLLAHRVNGVLVRIQGNPDSPHNRGALCSRGLGAIMQIYDPNRIKVPLLRTNPEKGKGVDPQWKQISFDEAFQIISEKLGKIRSENPRELMMVGGEAQNQASMKAFQDSFGAHYFPANFYGTVQNVMLMTTGRQHLEFDYDHCNYLIMFGNKGGGSNNDTTKAPSKMADARARGMKLIVVDPICSQSASKADEWLPIRPGTDGALALAMLNVLLNEVNIYDREFIKVQTNGPYLVDGEGLYVRDDALKPLIYDLSAGRAFPFDSPEIKDAAIEGSYNVNGMDCVPAFQLLKEHISKHTVEKASEITTIPAKTIRRIAEELGRAAQIGATIEINGKTLPLRPACIFPYTRNMVHKHGVWSTISLQLLNFVLGASDVPGGIMAVNLVGPDGTINLNPNPDGIVFRGAPLRFSSLSKKATAKLQEELPQSEAKQQTPFEAFKSSFPETLPVFLSMMHSHPDSFPFKPKALLAVTNNFVMQGIDSTSIIELVKKLEFVAILADRNNETVQFADVVLPVPHYLETYNFPANVFSGWVTHDDVYYTLRQPVVGPPEGTEGPMHVVDVFGEISHRLGLTREFNRNLGANVALKDAYRLEPDKKYSAAEVTDLQIRSDLGAGYDLESLKRTGLVSWPRPVEQKFPRALLKLPRLPIYYEHFIGMGQKLRSSLERLKADPHLADDFQALPDWNPCPTFAKCSIEGNAFHVVSYKLPFHTNSSTQGNPWLMEITERNPYALGILMNRKSAMSLNIVDGQKITLESLSNGVKLDAVAKLSERIHPEVLGIAASFGHWSPGYPLGKGIGTSLNELQSMGAEGLDINGMLDPCVAVKVLPREGA